jgi:hypothetical protein
MADYPRADEAFSSSDAKVELGQALYLRLQPLAGTPAEKYATETRKLPAATVSACADLRYLPPPIEGRPPQDHALVSLLRDDAGETCGFQLEFCTIDGARTAREPNKQSYATREHGVRDGLFIAGGAGDTAYLVEGYSSKAIAVRSLELGPTYGGGGLNVLGFAVPSERTVVIVPDREPAPDQWTKDGKERLCDLHKAAYERAVDRLIECGREVKKAAAPDCALHASCKDADSYLRQHGAIRLKGLLEQTTDCTLSLDGHARRCAKIKSPLKQAEAIAKVVADFGLKRTGTTGGFRAQVAQYAGKIADVDADDGAPERPPPVEDVIPWPEVNYWDGEDEYCPECAADVQAYDEAELRADTLRKELHMLLREFDAAGRSPADSMVEAIVWAWQTGRK